MLLLERHVEVKFATLANELARIAPAARLGDLERTDRHPGG
jgi:hypothetical protein